MSTELNNSNVDQIDDKEEEEDRMNFDDKPAAFSNCSGGLIGGDNLNEATSAALVGIGNLQ